MKAPAPPPPLTISGNQPVNTSFNSGTDPTRSQIGNISMPGSLDIMNTPGGMVSAGQTQSIDQMGGANSAFFQNMMAQLQPAFTQQRSEGTAAAKEASGTATGSGFANVLGKAINRSLGNEQATLANYAAQGVGMESQRQQADASRGLQAGIANQGALLNQYGMNAGNALAVGQANQGADIAFMNALLNRNAQGLQAQGMSSDAERFNSSQEAARKQFQSQLDENRNNLMYGGQLSTNQQNTNNFLQLLMQQSGIGAGPNTVQQSGGWGQFAGQLGGMALGSFLGPMGAAAGGALGKKIGGG